jgi:hypothetical protein
VDELRTQIQRNEALFKATQSSKAQLEADIAKRKVETDQMRTEVEKVNAFAKDEEEKRSKAVSLLKTVRQKLVKAEKDREDALKEMAALKESQKVEHDKEQLDRERLQSELNKLRIEKEVSLADHRAQFEKDIAALKQRSEKELSTLRSQFELETVAAKAWLTSFLVLSGADSYAVYPRAGRGSQGRSNWSPREICSVIIHGKKQSVRSASDASSRSGILSIVARGSSKPDH